MDPTWCQNVTQDGSDVLEVLLEVLELSQSPRNNNNSGTLISVFSVTVKNPNKLVRNRKIKLQDPTNELRTSRNPWGWSSHANPLGFYFVVSPKTVL